MISKFFMLWLVVTAVAFVWAWIFSKEQKTVAKFWLKKAAFSAAIALALIGAALILNNISGV